MSSTVDDSTGECAGWDKLRRRIEALRPVLMGQGSLVRLKKRAKSYWYLRYYEPVSSGGKQKSVYVGSDDNAQRVRELLERIRAPAEFLRETLRLADFARHLVKPLLRRGKRVEPQE